MNRPRVYDAPFLLYPPTIPLGFHRAPILGSLSHKANSHWLIIANFMLEGFHLSLFFLSANLYKVIVVRKGLD